MFSIATLTEFLGWCAVINIGIYFIAVIMFMFARELIVKMADSLLNVSREELLRVYLEYIAQYKNAIIFLNITPYFALKIMM